MLSNGRPGLGRGAARAVLCRDVTSAVRSVALAQDLLRAAEQREHLPAPRLGALWFGYEKSSSALLPDGADVVLELVGRRARAWGRAGPRRCSGTRGGPSRRCSSFRSAASSGTRRRRTTWGNGGCRRPSAADRTRRRRGTPGWRAGGASGGRAQSTCHDGMPPRALRTRSGASILQINLRLIFFSCV